MRTNIGVCNRKVRFSTEADAQCAAERGKVRLYPYRCALCRDYHLTSRTKGMFVGRKSDKAAR